MLKVASFVTKQLANPTGLPKYTRKILMLFLLHSHIYFSTSVIKKTLLLFYMQWAGRNLENLVYMRVRLTTAGSTTQANS